MKKLTKYTNGYIKINYIDDPEGSNTTVRWIAPTGEIIGQKRYNDELQAGKIRKGSPVTDDTPDGFPAEALAKEAAVIAGAETGRTQTKKFDSNDDDRPQFIVPDPKLNTSRPSAGKATAANIAKGIKTGLIISTSLVSTVVGLKDIAMQENEAAAISIPLANMIEADDTLNRKYGQLIANSGEAQVALYATGQYGFRVTQAVRARILENRIRRQNESARRAYGPTGSEHVQPSDNGAEYPGPVIFHRPAPSGLRAFTRTS